jgi:hypothetical protein
MAVLWPRCYYCEGPVHFPEVTIDHVLPKRLLAAPEKLSEAIEAFSLPSNFRVNDYRNWLPCHFRCNTAKGRPEVR